ncbi:MAG: metal ABC transporter permease [Rhodothermales bacterium]|nr:metal ABC transporter permease [Rhodothermales bacterium]MBO6780299.1 metal ABC transporter permease [Rhodothermales bacterium]
MLELFSDYTLRVVALGAAVLGMSSGALGTYAVLRRQSLLGDAISHAALPGIALAFMLTGSKAPLVLVLGAALAGWLGTLVIMGVTETSRIKYDSALGMMLSVFFGFGLVLLTFLQRRPDANQAGLDSFLFGQAAALQVADVLTMAGIGGLALVVVVLLWKEFKVLSFDPDFGRTTGLPIRKLDLALTGLLVISIVIGLQTVGVVLMSAMIISPAAAARQWTDRLGRMVLLSAGFGALAGVVGAAISSTQARLPTGPTIVVAVSVIVGFSLFLAPNRGIVWARLRAWQAGRRLRMDAVLMDLYLLATQHESHEHPHDRRVLDAMSFPRGATRRNLRLLKERGYVQRIDARRWALTDTGAERARRLETDLPEGWVQG